MKCKKCKQSKKRDDFYKAHPNICKVCYLAYQREWKDKNWNEYVKKAKAYYLSRRKKQSKYYKDWYKKTGKKKRMSISNIIELWVEENTGILFASRVLSSEVRKGKIDRPKKCSCCGKKGKRIVGHHTDYSKPLKVVWLCDSCHRREHHRRKQ